MSEIARKQGFEPAIPEKVLTIKDWVDALNPEVLTPRAWANLLNATQIESKIFIEFINSESEVVRDIQRIMTPGASHPDTGEKVHSVRDMSSFVKDPHGTPVSLVVDYYFKTDGDGGLVSDSDRSSTFSDGLGRVLDPVKELSMKPGSLIKVRDASGAIHLVHSTDGGWDFTNIQYDVDKSNLSEMISGKLGQVGAGNPEIDNDTAR